MNPSRTPLAVLLGDLHAAGLTLRLDRGSIAYAPESVMTPELRARLVAEKSYVVALLEKHGDRLLALFAFGPEDVPPAAAVAVPDRERLTENQCGQCLEWRMSKLVQLGSYQRIYLCESCRTHRGIRPKVQGGEAA